MSKQAFKRMRRALGMEVSREPLDAFAWPGGYQMYYLVADCETICPDCVNKNITLIDDDTKNLALGRKKGFDAHNCQWAVVEADINYEERCMICCNCYQPIPAAYGDDDDATDPPA